MTNTIDPCALRVADEALALRRSHPQAPAIDVLLLVFKGRQGLQFPIPASVDAPLIGPRSDFGQLIAAAFDQGMTPDEWLALTGPSADPKLVAALLQVWCDTVLPRFAERLGCKVC